MIQRGDLSIGIRFRMVRWPTGSMLATPNVAAILSSRRFSVVIRHECP